MNNMILKAHGVCKSFQSGTKQISVLRGINLSLHQGEFAVISGPSGAGKSTLLHILGGLDTPDSGTVTFESRDIFVLSDPALSRLRNQSFGFVFQFYQLLPEFTVLENVLMPAIISKRKGSVENYARQLLTRVGLRDRLEHFPPQLSGGEKQRVALVRGLINQPQLLLCDEPTGNLDSKTGEEIIRIVRELNKENKMAVVLVTHNQALAKQADSVYYLNDGVFAN